MKAEDKELLLKDLCGRLSSGVKGVVVHYNEETNEPSNVIGVCRGINYLGQVEFFYLDMEGAFNRFPIEDFKPYLRPMSSMIEKEREEFFEKWGLDGWNIDTFDWLNTHYFDYRGLIKKGLAIEVTEDNNPYKD